MDLSREILLRASESQWCKRHVPTWPFVRAATRRFLPGETFEAAFAEAIKFRESGIASVFTELGENVTHLGEAESVAKHYCDVLDRIAQQNLNAEVSLKLTHLGLDISREKASHYFKRIVDAATPLHSTIWIDMESSPYTDATLDFYKRQRSITSYVGICLQAYLRRTARDLEELLPLSPTIRLVKGAYKEPSEVAFPRKKEVDHNFFQLSLGLLDAIRDAGIRVAFATHDIRLIEQIKEEARKRGLEREQLEFQFLYGIKTEDQYRLAREGFNVRVLISYGSAWFSWYMRRLAERPANVLFVLRQMLS